MKRPPKAKRVAGVRRKTAERGYGWDWQQFRKRQAAAIGYCQRCYEMGELTEGQELHHVVPVRANRVLRLDPSNVRYLCYSCHKIEEMECQP